MLSWFLINPAKTNNNKTAGLLQFIVLIFFTIRKLFWVDRGYPPKLESSNVDGSGRKDLVKDEMIWPNGLALDYPNKRIYWTDTKKRTIETVDYSGNDRKIVKLFEGDEGIFILGHQLIGSNSFMSFKIYEIYFCS